MAENRQNRQALNSGTGQRIKNIFDNVNRAQI